MKWRSINQHHCKDSAFALVFIFLIIYLATGRILPIKIAAIVSLVAMVVPGVFKPFAWFWFSLSSVLGLFVPMLVLSLIFFVFVLPVGLIRKLLGRDDMKLKAWKSGVASVFAVKDHLYVPEDLHHPF